MKKFNINRKAFTLTELIVVIAIIGILSVVMIPVLTGCIEDAKVSNDTVLVANINKVLSANEILDGKNKTAHEAINDAFEAGYGIEKLTPTANGYYFLWDAEYDEFVLMNKSFGEIYPNNKVRDPKAPENLFGLAADDTEFKALKAAGHSIYLKDNFPVKKIEVNSGLDVGNNIDILEVLYKNQAIDQEKIEAQNVIIRTNGYDTTLTIDAPNDEVDHYGLVKEVNIYRVKMGTYMENGTVSGNINLAQGKVEMNEGSSCSNIVIKELPEIENVLTKSTPTENTVGIIINSNSKVNTVISKITIEKFSSVVTGVGANNVGMINPNDTNEAYIGKIGYATLEAALEAAKDNTTITLMRNKDISSDIFIDKKDQIVLDLNNNKITFKDEDNEKDCCFKIGKFGKSSMKIKNGTVYSNASKGNTSVILIYENSEIVCEGITIEHSMKGYAVTIGRNNGKMIINSGEYNGIIGTNGNYSGNNVIINGGTFNEGCYFPAGGSYTINGGNFTAHNDSIFYWKSGASLNINGGSFKVNLDSDYKNEWAHYENGCIGGNAVFVFEACNYDNRGENPRPNISSNVEIIVNRGNYNGAFYDILVINYEYNNGAPNEVDCSGIKKTYRVANGQIEGHVSKEEKVPSDGWITFNDLNTTEYENN